MKIIHLISGGDVGGAKTHVLSLLSGLSKRHDVLLVCFTKGSFSAEAEALGINTRIIKTNVLSDCRTIAGLIREEGYQVIHCHGSRANMMGAIIRTMVNVPVVSTIHSDYRLDYLGRPLHRITFGNINKIALRFLDYYIGVSDAFSQLLISRGFDPQRIFTIYNGIDFSTPLHPVERDAFLDSIGLQREPDSVVFGIAARISPVKNMGTLIRAFASTVAEFPSARLIIAGDGEQAEELKALAKELCPPNTVLFAGWIADTDSFYNALDVNMLTSLSESFPYALSEGARMHCATIASQVGGIPYLIDNEVNGLLFPAQDVALLAQHMKLLAGDADLRRQLGDSLYEKTKNEFSLDATVQHQEEIYQAILRKTERKKHKKRDGVLICGAYGKHNAGDDAILRAIIQQMRSIDADIPIYALSRNPMETRLMYRIGTCHTFNAPRFLSLMRRTRLYISGGGTLIQNITSTRSLLYYLSNISFAHSRKNHVMMYGCGIGPVNGALFRRITSRTISRCVDTIALRDEDSAKELRSMEIGNKDIHLTADPALLLTMTHPEKTKSILHAFGLSQDTHYIMFAPRPWAGMDSHLDDFAAAAQYAYDRHGLIPVLFALEPNRDEPVTTEIAKKLTCPCIRISAVNDADTILAIIGQMDAVISMRLHALVFACAMNVPMGGVVYDPKVSGFLEYANQENYVNLSELSAQKLIQLTDAALSSASISAANAQRLHMLAKENATLARKALEE